MIKKATYESLNDLTMEERDRYIEELGSVGITHPGLLRSVVIAGAQNDGLLKSLLTESFQHDRNALIFGYSGFGKALPNYQGVLTPAGYVPIGNIRVGDLVASNDGNFYPVTGVYPQGKQPVYEIEFNYGIKVRASDEHIWTVSRDYGKTYHNETTAEIVEKGYAYTEKPTGWVHHKVELPPVKPLEMPEKELPIDPYLLGCLIGDGCLSKGALDFSTMDQFIVDKLNIILSRDWKMQLRKAASSQLSDYLIAFIDKANGKALGGTTGKSPLKAALVALGVAVTGDKKLIPKEYLFASIEQRQALLDGLFDTDGYVAKNGQLEYVTVSKKLAQDVKFLAESLGFNVRTNNDIPSFYLYKGKKKRAKDTYYLALYGEGVVSTLPRKVNRLRTDKKSRQRLRIYDISFIGKEECTCISVAAPNKLFLTEHAVPTHNTAQVEQAAAACNMDVHPITVATKLPEDFGGRPMAELAKIPRKVKEAKAKKILAENMARPELNRRIEDAEAQGAPLSDYQKAALFKKLIAAVHVTQDEIDEEVDAIPSDEGKRWQEAYAAPGWLNRIKDKFETTGRRTVLFLDELNQAHASTLNALYQLVDKRIFADEEKYSLKHCVVMAAAGNFMSENETLTPLPDPLIRRFSAIIINPRVWEDSLNHLYTKYLGIHKGIANMVLSLDPDDCEAELHSPAVLEDKLRMLVSIVEQQTPVLSKNPFGLSEGKVKLAFMKFYDSLNLSEDSEYSAPTSAISTDAQLMREINGLYADFKAKGVAIIKDASGNTIPDTSHSASKTFVYGRAGSKENYLATLRELPKYASIKDMEELWEIETHE